MDKTERVTLTGAYEHPVHGEQRVFAAGEHTLPSAIAAGARAAGLVAAEDPASAQDAQPADASAARKAKPRARKAKA